MALAVALALSALALLVLPDSARANHICQVSPASSSYSVNEGGSVTLSANSSGCTSINWDLDNDGFYDEATGETVTFSASDRDGPGSQTVGIQGVKPNAEQICESDPELGEICYWQHDYDYAETTVNLLNVAPKATFNAPQTSYAGKTFVVSLTDPYDPSSADRAAGFTYAFDCGSGYGAFTGTSVASCQAGSAGTSKTVKGKIRDKDGGVNEYTRTVSVTAAPPSYPNGRIAFQSHRDGNYEIYAMNADGTNETRLTNNAAHDQGPAFSPSGSKIAFGSGRDGNNEIYTMKADGTEQTNLTNNAAHDYHPAFSPDGSKITFVSTRDGNAEIYVMNSDGTGQTRLTNNAAFESNPAFSPDGSKIAFHRFMEADNYDIYVMNASGTGQTQLTSNTEVDYYPTFSPDGSKIAFASTRDGGYLEIYTMNPDGTVVTRLTNNRESGLETNWGGVDNTPPETTLDPSGPSGSVNSTSANFSFSSEPDSIFECKLDGGAFERCESPKAYSSLSAGEHIFEVRAIDTSGNTDPTPASRTWTVDVTAPTVTGVSPVDLASGVSQEANVTATFSESSMDAATLNGTTFTLTKQGATTPITAAVGYDAGTATLNPNADLDPLATYTATVKGGSDGAKDLAGNPLVTDETWSFTTADTRAPNVSLTAPADGATVRGIVQLSAEATDNTAVDQVEFLVNAVSVGVPDTSAPYERNWDSTDIDSDTVRIAAKAYDAAGNATTSTAHTVNVDNVAPETTLDASGPSGTVTSTSASFSFSSEAGATFECSLDNGAFESCASPKTYTALSDGSHTFSVRAKDAAGNVDASPASRTWTVDATAPTVTGVTPTADATNVALSENVTATFSEAMNASTLTNTTFTLTRQGAASAVTATVSYDAASKKATLNPEANLEADVLYTASVKGGSGGARDLAGNPLAQDKV